MTSKRLLAALVTASALAGVTAICADATTAPTNGRIVFSENVGSGTQLFTMKADGTAITQLTHYPENRERASSGRWSPDGRLIAFSGEFPNRGSVYVMRADGTHVRRACPARFNYCGGDPDWSPSGRSLVMPALHGDEKRRICDAGLRLISLKGKLIRNITHSTSPAACIDERQDLEPSFSPDGRRIAFSASRPSTGAICVIGVNGRGRKCLTDFAGDYAHPAWSPDGTRILFQSDQNNARPRVTANLFTIRPDGSGLTQITHLSGPGYYTGAGAWSPDGTQIIYRKETPDGSDLFVIDADGGNERQLTHLGPEAHAAAPDWGTNQQ